MLITGVAPPDDAIGDVPVTDVIVPAPLLLKVFQSVDDNDPLVVADAVAMLITGVVPPDEEIGAVPPTEETPPPPPPPAVVCIVPSPNLTPVVSKDKQAVVSGAMPIPTRPVDEIVKGVESGFVESSTRNT